MQIQTTLIGRLVDLDLNTMSVRAGIAVHCCHEPWRLQPSRTSGDSERADLDLLGDVQTRSRGADAVKLTRLSD